MVDRSVFAGRVDELGTLERALDRARAGSPTTVLVGGCMEMGAEGLPYAPFSAVLRQLVREIGVDGVAAITPGGQRDLGRLLPEFSEPRAEAGSEADSEARSDSAE